jgi:hypothetical protein
MAGWQASVDRYLYGGEEVQLRVGTDDAGVVVTTHRVHAFTPADEGSNYRVVERPNVTDVSRRTTGEMRWLVAGVKALFVGLFLFGGGFLVDFDGLLAGVAPDWGSQIPGMGVVLQLFSVMRAVFGVLDEVLLLSGLVALLAGVGGVGAYAATRTEAVYVEVAGGDDLTLPTEALSTVDVSKLSGALSGPPFEEHATGPPTDAADGQR